MNHRSASLLLLLLLSADLIFIALHIIYNLTPMLDARFDIGRDRGFAEVFGYIKFFWISILFACVCRSTRSGSYLAWMSVFIYFLVDDSMQLHERIGGIVASRFHFHPPFNLRLQDFGELTVSATAGVVLSIVLASAYWRGSHTFRNVSKDMLLLVLVLVFFGVFVDMAHMTAADGSLISGGLAVAEDGGEMMAVSLMLWYVFLLAIRKGEPGLFLHDLLRKRQAGHQAPK
jgi:hypothetical protein